MFRKVVLYLIVPMLLCFNSAAATTVVLKSPGDLDRARKLIDMGKYSEAVELLQKIPKGEKEKAVKRNIVKAYIKMKDIPNGVNAIKEACSFNIESYCDSSWGSFLRKNGRTELDMILARQLYDNSLSKERIRQKDWMPLVTAMQEAGEHDKLKWVFEALLKRDPGSGKYYANFIIESLNDQNAAREVLQRAVQYANAMTSLSQNDRLETLENLCVYYRERGLKESLLEYLAGIQEDFAESPSALLYIAKQYYVYGKYVAARRIYQSLFDDQSVKPFYVKKATVEYAHMLVRAGNRRIALDMLDKSAVSAQNSKAKLHYHTAALDIIVNYSPYSNFPEISKRFDAAVSLDPKGKDALKLLEYICTFGREYPSQHHFVDLGTILYKERCGYEGYDIFARYLSDIGSGRKAMGVIRDGIDKFKKPAFRSVLLNTALLIAGENRFYDDFFILQKELSNLSNYHSVAGRGMIYERYFNDYQTAFETFEKAFDLAGSEEEKAEAVLSMARCRYKAGKLADADSIITKYSHNNSDWQSILFVSRYYSVYAKDRQQAIKVLGKILSEEKDAKTRSKILKGMGDAFIAGSERKPDKARQYYEKALELSDDTDIYAMLALTYNNYTDDFEKTQEYLDIILAREPENPLYLSWSATNLARYYETRNQALSIAYMVPADKRSKYSLACIYARLGEKDQAMNLLETYFKQVYAKKGKYERNERRLWMLADNDLKLLRVDPRFAKLTVLEK